MKLDKKQILLNIPYVLVFYLVNKGAWLYRYCVGETAVVKLGVMLMNYQLAFTKIWPSFYPKDLLIGALASVGIKLILIYRTKNAKKFRQGEEYGSARWGTPKDIEPFMDPVFENNIILTQTERLTMNSRPKKPKYARNKNVIVIGGSGSGKTRFFIKPNIMQLNPKVSLVVTDHSQPDIP